MRHASTVIFVLAGFALAGGALAQKPSRARRATALRRS